MYVQLVPFYVAGCRCSTIVSASIKVNPLVLVKRTWVPLMAGVLTVLLLSFLGNIFSILCPKSLRLISIYQIAISQINGSLF